METKPLRLCLCKADYLSFCYVRIAKGSNVKEAINHITTVVGEIAPELPLDIEFYDTVFQRLYQKEIKTSATTIFMAILAILISIIGVFGMVTFDTEYKRQEISIRKVFGAGNSNIFKSVNLKYIKMVGNPPPGSLLQSHPLILSVCSSQMEVFTPVSTEWSPASQGTDSGLPWPG